MTVDTMRQKIGLSEKNMNSENKLVGRIERYHLYFDMARFLKYQKRLEAYVTSEDIEILQPHFPGKDRGSIN